MQYPTKVVAAHAVTTFLGKTYGWTLERSLAVLAIARWVYPGYKAEPTKGGFVSVALYPESKRLYIVEDHTGRKQI
jgi:hypothetical protein